MAKRFPLYRQLDMMDCGPSCLRMIAQYYGKHFSLSSLREACNIDREGTSLQSINDGAEKIGFRCYGVKIPFISDNEEEASLQDVHLPCIIHWNQSHYIVVYKINKKHVWIADPAAGKFKIDRAIFEKGWLSGNALGIALLFEPSPDFYQQEGEQVDKTSFWHVLSYIRPYRKYVIQLVLGFLIASVLQLIFPFLTQAVVDVGIANQDFEFVYLILAAQLMLFIGESSVNIIQSWIFLHISTRVNISMIYDFLLKLTRLPMRFFDAKMIGDLLQRVNDHSRVESFLTNSLLSILFAISNIIIFSIVLAIYDLNIFLVFLVLSTFYLAWVFLFLKKRKKIDHYQFIQMADNNSNLIEFIQGMPEIKLQTSERKKSWQWAGIQAKLFKADLRALAVSQWQNVGGGVINQFKNILIAFLAASAVIKGEITLGMMLSIQYIIGQLNGPLSQMIGFIQSGQDAMISLQRLGEIHKQEEEESDLQFSNQELPINGDLTIEELSFAYNPQNGNVLKNINLTIPQGKTTAIVGSSGSGKTTLVKLLLGFYQPTRGDIKLDDIPLSRVSPRAWRKRCGAVLQDGYIFSDTIANNISESDDYPDPDKLAEAIRIANIESWVRGLHLRHKTPIGLKGNAISQGQRQRILIARAVYKNPSVVFLDEATNALDTRNEKIIMENLREFVEDRTVIVVAHRLSTVKNADQIIVLENGEVVEIGTHKELLANHSHYYELIHNQLELEGHR